MQKNSEKFDEAGIQLVGVSYDSPAILKRLSEKMKIKFPLLSDTESKAIKSYGLLNKKAKGRQAGIPHPATIVINRAGVIQAKLAVGVYKRHSPKQLLEAAAEKPKPEKASK